MGHKTKGRPLSDEKLPQKPENWYQEKPELLPSCFYV